MNFQGREALDTVVISMFLVSYTRMVSTPRSSSLLLVSSTGSTRASLLSVTSRGTPPCKSPVGHFTRPSLCQSPVDHFTRHSPVPDSGWSLHSAFPRASLLLVTSPDTPHASFMLVTSPGTPRASLLLVTSPGTLRASLLLVTSPDTPHASLLTVTSPDTAPC